MGGHLAAFMPVPGAHQLDSQGLIWRGYLEAPRVFVLVILLACAMVAGIAATGWCCACHLVTWQRPQQSWSGLSELSRCKRAEMPVPRSEFRRRCSDHNCVNSAQCETKHNLSSAITRATASPAEPFKEGRFRSSSRQPQTSV